MAGKHSCCNKDILITHIKWQELKTFRGRRSENSQDQIVFLKLTMVEERMQKSPTWGLSGSMDNPCGCLGFFITLTMCLMNSHFLSILTSLIQEHTVAMLQKHQYGQSLALRGHFCRSWMDHILHMCHSLYRFCCCCLCMKVSQGTSLILRFSPYSVSLSLGDRQLMPGHIRLPRILFNKEQIC